MTSSNNAQPKTPYTPEQLGELSEADLAALADQLGLPVDGYPASAELIEMILARQKLVSQLDRLVLVELMQWGHCPVRSTEGTAELAGKVSQIRKMRFSGLSDRALRALALLRGLEVDPQADTDTLTHMLKRRETVVGKLARKRRRLIGRLVTKLIGEDEDRGEDESSARQRQPSLKDRIEDRGLVGGLADRLRGAADDYVALKLDEIERRIDRKLDDIDRRLAEWRDREIANRLRIIKITLVVSVVVASISALMALLKKALGW